MGFPNSLLERIARWLRRWFPQRWRRSAESRADGPGSKVDSEQAAESRQRETPLLIIPNHYAVTGHLRPRKAIPSPAESKPEDAATFVPPPAEKPASMQGWGELVLQAPIRENGETVEPQEPRPPLRLPSCRTTANCTIRKYRHCSGVPKRASASLRRMLRRRSAARLRILTCETMSDPQKNECTMNWNRDYG